MFRHLRVLNDSSLAGGRATRHALTRMLGSRATPPHLISSDHSMVRARASPRLATLAREAR